MILGLETPCAAVKGLDVTHLSSLTLKTWRQSAAAAAILTVASTANAGGFKVTPLVTDNQAVLATLGYGSASTTDAALINPWDFANSGTGPWVIANAGGNGSGIALGTATSYTGRGSDRVAGQWRSRRPSVLLKGA